MSDWPELERRLLESAKQRSGHRWRSWARRALVPMAVALAAVALVAVVRSPSASDEREVGPAAATPVAVDTTGPGLNGTQLDAVAYGDRTLQPGAMNRLAYGEGQQFTVALTNQGENDEFNVKVSVRIRPADGDGMTITRVLPRIAAGEHGTIELPLDREPPIDRAATVDVVVAKVPGERGDDNRLSFPVLFSADAKPETSVKPVDVAELRETEAVRDDLASGGELARAWEVPALKGHVHLIRTPDGWCLSVPDPLTDQPEIERGKTCTDAATFATRGIQIGIGSTSVSVGPEPDAPLKVGS